MRRTTFPEMAADSVDDESSKGRRLGNPSPPGDGITHQGFMAVLAGVSRQIAAVKPRLVSNELVWLLCELAWSMAAQWPKSVEVTLVLD